LNKSTVLACRVMNIKSLSFSQAFNCAKEQNKGHKNKWIIL